MKALSPSSQTLTDAVVRFAELIPTANGQIRRFPRCPPKDQSVALLVHSDHASVLLGADPEPVSDPDRDWRAAISSPARPRILSHALKVAHHSSENRDLDDIWSTLLQPDLPALLTPYASGRKPLPSDNDVGRLKSRTSQVFCTSWPPTRKARKRHAAIDRTIREMTRMHRSVHRRVGHIRLRMSLSQTAPP